MPSRGSPVPPQGRGWGPAKSSCVNGFAGGPAVAWCSGSAVIVTGATDTAASATGGKRGDNRWGTYNQIREAGGQVRKGRAWDASVVFHGSHGAGREG